MTENKITRRSFVERSLAAGATLALPTHRVLGANSDVRVAIIGCGGKGTSHLRDFATKPGVRIVGISDPDKAHMNSAENQLKNTLAKQGANVDARYRQHQDFRHILDRPDVDVVVIATPNHWHALLTVMACQAGKDVYVEKPVSHCIWEGRKSIEAARKYNRIVQAGTQQRSDPALIHAAEDIRKGTLGAVQWIHSLWYRHREPIGKVTAPTPIPAGIDYDLWCGPGPKGPLMRKRLHYDWHWQRLYGNGDLGNQGPHQTDIARWGLGIDEHPSSIISYGGRLGYQAERKDNDYVDAGDTANTEVSIYDYGDKCIVFETRGLDVTKSDDEELNRLFGNDSGNKIGVVFYGSEGYLAQTSYTHCTAFDKDFNVIKKFSGGGNHFRNFIDACISRDADQLNADAWEGHLSAAVSHLGNISYYLGEDNRVSIEQLGEALDKVKSLDDNGATLERTVQHLKRNGVDLAKYSLSLGPQLQFDPKKETFANSADANALLTREYRDGFVCPDADAV